MNLCSIIQNIQQITYLLIKSMSQGQEQIKDLFNRYCALLVHAHTDTRLPLNNFTGHSF